MTGHHKRVNDLSFCTSETYQTHMASIGDDGLIIWNLYPPSTDQNDSQETELDNPDDSFIEVERSLEPKEEDAEEPMAPPPLPTAYVVKFPHALHSISSHPSSANQFVVSDVQGTVFIVDWTKKGHRVVELVDPRALTDSLTGGKCVWTGGASWKRDDINV